MSSNATKQNRMLAAMALATVYGHDNSIHVAHLHSPIVEVDGDLIEQLEELLRGLLHLTRLNELDLHAILRDAHESHAEDWAAEINEATEAAQWQL